MLKKYITLEISIGDYNVRTHLCNRFIMCYCHIQPCI